MGSVKFGVKGSQGGGGGGLLEPCRDRSIQREKPPGNMLIRLYSSETGERIERQDTFCKGEKGMVIKKKR